MHLKTFTNSVRTYVQGIGDVTAADREALRAKWESDLGDEEDAPDMGYGMNFLDDDDDPFSSSQLNFSVPTSVAEEESLPTAEMEVRSMT